MLIFNEFSYYHHISGVRMLTKFNRREFSYERNRNTDEVQKRKNHYRCKNDIYYKLNVISIGLKWAYIKSVK
jgi:hypothetical protein